MTSLWRRRSHGWANGSTAMPKLTSDCHPFQPWWNHGKSASLPVSELYLSSVIVWYVCPLLINNIPRKNQFYKLNYHEKFASNLLVVTPGRGDCQAVFSIMHESGFIIYVCPTDELSALCSWNINTALT
jgi:hypothetical protein